MVKLGRGRQFDGGLGNPHIYLVFGFGLAFLQPYLQFLYAGRLYEYGQGFFRINLFDVQSAYHVYVEDDILSLGPDPVYFTFKGAVEIIAVDLFPFQEFIVFNLLLEIVKTQEIVIFSIYLVSTGLSGGGRNGKNPASALPGQAGI